LVRAAGAVSVVLRGRGMLGHVSGGKPHLAAALPVWAPRMVLAVADILEEAAHADGPARVRRASGGGSGRLSPHFRRLLWSMRGIASDLCGTRTLRERCWLQDGPVWLEGT